MSLPAAVLPYLVFTLPAAAASLLPAALAPSITPWIDPFRAAAGLVTLVVLLRRGALPEVSRGPAAPVLAIGAGIAVAALWMPLAVLVPALGAGRAGFDGNAAGEAAAPVLWGARLLASICVVPFAEELLVRGFLPRWTDDPERWRERPIGAYTPLSATVSLAFFTLTHPEWLAAFVSGGLWMLLLRRTGRLADAVLAHAVANALLAAFVVVTGDTTWW